MKPILATDAIPWVRYDPTICRWTLREDWLAVLSEPLAVIHIPAGFTSDLASNPRLFRNAIASYELSIEAALLHDFLYRHQGVLPPEFISPYRTFTREEADLVFLEIMKAMGVRWWRRQLAYPSVRAFGILPWRRGSPSPEGLAYVKQEEGR